MGELPRLGVDFMRLRSGRWSAFGEIPLFWA